MKDFLVQLVEKTNVSFDGTHIGLVTFGNVGLTRFRLDEYSTKAGVISAIKALPSGNGETNLYSGLVEIRNLFSESMGGRPWVNKIAVILTDGIANVNVEKTVPEARNAYFVDGIKIFMIGITNDIDLKQLKEVSSPPQQEGKTYWTSPDFISLNKILQNLQTITCNQDKVVYPGNEKLFVWITPLIHRY